MTKNDLIYQIGLTLVNGVGNVLARNLLGALGSAEAVFTEKPQLLAQIPGIGAKHIAEIRRSDVLRIAEREVSFIEKHKIETFMIAEPGYPERLRDCPDAPFLLYFKGKTNLNASRVISIVGTRKGTSYGRTMVEKLIHDLAGHYPNVLIVSGLAYGIDIQVHRSAVENHLPTVGVLAHGLDTIYPPTHKETARQMTGLGGLLTDYPSGTNPDRQNFVKRNRIVAGLSEATLVIESAAKGGSLITAEIAYSYGRKVFALPGRTTDELSQGCNILIARKKATLITSADDLIRVLRWEKSTHSSAIPVQVPIAFPTDSPSRKILSLFQGEKEMHINELSRLSGIPIYELSPILFEMELQGCLRIQPGGVYALVSN